ncbi:dipeptide ABC transporter ATP-binding protein [Streptomyces flavalbus]|uniref:Dipeptide ABC transporter ATP-binding protein n=1 Tax=Streptomyces flavalbus TaxID=2665155 RepID=A0ABW2W469_9ACTN
MTGPGEVLLEVRGLRVARPASRRAPELPLVHGVDLRLRRGEVLGLVGESGAGKSLTALALLGLCPPGLAVSGSVRLLGREIVGMPGRELARLRGRRIALVFQDALAAFTPVLRIGDQIGEAIRVHQEPRPGRAAARRAAAELLDAVGVAEAGRVADAYPHQLSGGTRQRAMIAMAMANRPDVIVADEPTSAMDGTVRDRVVRALVTARRATGAALLLVSHDLGVVAGAADRVAVMYGGRIVETAAAEALYARPRMPYTKGLLGSVPRIDSEVPPTPMPGGPPAPGAPGPGCAFAPRCPLADRVCEARVPALVGVDGHLTACHHAGEAARRGAAELFPPAGRRRGGGGAGAGETVLRISGLGKAFPGTGRGAREVWAVAGVDLEVRRGETLALVGESGCGKSTTLREVMALTAPRRGRVEVLGMETGALSREAVRRLRGALQYVPQDPMASLDPRMPVGDIVAEPLWARRVPPERAAVRVAEVLELVGLGAAAADAYPHRFSGGERQRIAIARALAGEPELLLLDEPVSALDVSVRAGILDLLRRLTGDHGPSCLVVSHDLAAVRHLADRVAVMRAGRVVETGRVREVFERPAHPYTRVLVHSVPVPDPVVERRRLSARSADPPTADDGTVFLRRSDRVVLRLPRRQVHPGADQADDEESHDEKRKGS